MESVENFIKIFFRAWKSKNADSLVRVLKDVPDYVQNVSKTDAARALEIIFDEKKGLLKFIETVLEMQKSEMKVFQMPLKESFYALQNIMMYFMLDYDLYIRDTRNICFRCMKTMCWYYARKAAAETLKKLIELFAQYNLEFHEIIEHFQMNYLKLYNIKEGSVFYIVFGQIAKCNPVVKKMIECADEIFLYLLSDIKTQYKPTSENQPEEMKIYLECLSDMLLKFEPSETVTNSDYFENLYECLKVLCEPNKAQKMCRNKAIYLLISHKQFFISLIYKDYKKWHELLNNILEEDENSTIIQFLKAFYTVMAKAEDLLLEFDEALFVYFKTYLLNNLSNKNLSICKQNVIISGVGEFAKACKKYRPNEIDEMYEKLALQSFSFYEKENEFTKNFDILPETVEALSKVLICLPNVSLHQLNIIIHLSTQLIKQFPELKLSYKNNVKQALINAFLNILHLEENMRHLYFNYVFCQGVLWSCSHALYIDVELQKETESLSQHSISYKDYLPLWYSLNNIDAAEISDEFLNVFIPFIDKLNLKTVPRDDIFFSSTYLSMQAENETDFRFFINLVSLYVDIFENVNISLLCQESTVILLTNFIKYSYRYPLVSGFYKLIEATFKSVVTIEDFESVFLKSTWNFIFQYLSDVLKLLCEFSDELQLTCIYLILNSPICCIKVLINQLIPVFKIAFTIGLTDLKLAFFALDTLLKWRDSLDVKLSKTFFQSIVSFMEPYLTSEESSIYNFHTARRKKENVENSIADIHESLETFQNKILLFYGSLNSHVLFDFIHEKSLSTNSSWNKKNLLPCELLFPDIRLEIHFDKFISRVLDLTKSGDRKTKVSACELLHTIITIILGKKLIDQCFNKNLCYTILQLSCDPDDTVRNLYHPLVLQLTHYLSSSLMKESRRSQEFIDMLFDGLTEELNSSLRDYCGLYLKEFVEWSIKQSNENDLTNLLNVRSIIRKIKNFALYPSNQKCLAAAIAFNHLFMIFKQNEKIVNTYWLEFLYVFIKSLEEYGNEQTITSLSYVEQVLKENSNIFNAKFSKRRKPFDFSDETLNGTLKWLFINCGSRNMKCRQKCMELFENLFPYVLNNELVQDLMHDANEIILKDLEADIEFITIANIQIFIKSLDFYIWILRNKFVPITDFYLIFSGTQNNNVFLKNYTSFIHLLVNENTETSNTVDQNVETSNSVESEEIINLKSEMILKIVEFLSAVLVEKQIDPKDLFWNNDSYLLITYCVLCPYKIGIADKMLQITDKLSDQLQILLTVMKSNLPEEYLKKSQKYFVEKIEENFSPYLQMCSSRKEKHHIIKQFYKGMLTIRKSNFLDFEKECGFTINHIKATIKEAFSKLSNYRLCNYTMEHLQELMKFLMDGYEPKILQYIISFIQESCSVEQNDGIRYIKSYKESIFSCMLKDPIQTMIILDEFLNNYPCEILTIIEMLLIFSEGKRTNNAEILCDEVIKRNNILQRISNDMKDRKTIFFNINRLAVLIKRNPADVIKTNEETNDFYSWILQQIMNSKCIDEKMSVLENFHKCFTSEGTHNELLLIFRQLRDRDSMIWLQQLQSHDSKRLEATACLQSLLKMLNVSKTLFLYQTIIEYTVGACTILFNEDSTNNIKIYIDNLCEVTALKSLQLVYNMFLDLHSTQERLDVLKYFLLPSLSFSKTSVIEEFYNEKCSEMASYVLRRVESNNTMDRNRLIVTKIGCFNIFELILVKFDLKIINVEDPVTKIEKPLNQALVYEALEVRRFSAQNKEEKEVARLLHCAAFNCCIALVSLKDDEKFYKYIFFEKKKENQLIWEKIVDCDKNYDFRQNSSTIRRDRKKLINIRVKNSSSMAFYVPQYNLRSLSFFEDIHAYDFNDIKLRTDAVVKFNGEQDCRLDLSFEIDELNSHECMPMITGVLIHMFNNEIAQLPDSYKRSNPSHLPPWLELLQAAFINQKDNVTIFLLKILSNVKKMTLAYMSIFFRVVLSSINLYLVKNQLNYIIRDFLVIVVESEYELSEEADKKVALQLIYRLIEKTKDSQLAVYRYNLEILEILWNLWSNKLEYPEIIERKINTDPEHAIRIILIILRKDGIHAATLAAKYTVNEFVKNAVKNWKDDESTVLLKFEALGLLMFRNEISYEELELNSLYSLFNQMNSQSRERCARCVCVLYKACRSETKCSRFIKFVDFWQVTDNRKPECLELFLLRISNLEPVQVSVHLVSLNLRSILIERILGCEHIALSIVEKLIPILADSELRPYIEITAGFIGLNNIVEHRRMAYKIFMAAYKRFQDLCLQPLVAALSDPNEDLQMLVFDFWRESIQLPEICSERLLAIMSMYRPDLKQHFARFACLLMLDLTRKSIDNNRIMFSSLIDCRFEDYQILISRRRKNLGSMAPLFVTSMASQLSQLGQLSQFQKTQCSSFAASMRLLATQIPEYQASNLQSAAKKIPDPSQNKLSKRSLTNSSQSSSIRSGSALKKRSEYFNQSESELEQQQNSIRLYRKYRIGDFPDVEISHATFVESLKQFIIRDWLSCKDLLVQMVNSLIDRLKGGEKYEGFMACLSETSRRALQEPEEGTNNFTSAVLEIMCHSKEIHLDAVSVQKACKALSLNSLGILLLEEDHMRKKSPEENLESPCSKKRKLVSAQKHNWLELASLYRSIGEVDVVHSIFKRSNLFPEDLRNGALAQAEGNWSEARRFYENAWEIAIGSEKDHCLEGTFECLSHLTSWREINKKIDQILDGNYNSVWQHSKKNQLLPYIFDAQLQQALESYTANFDVENDEFLKNIRPWMGDNENEIKKIFGDHLAIIFLCGEEDEVFFEKARYYLKSCLDHSREQWIHVNPLSEKIRQKLLLKFRMIYNINVYLTINKDLQRERSPAIKSITKFIDYWDQHLPSLNEDFVSWAKLVTCRTTFAHRLHETISSKFKTALDEPVLESLLHSSLIQRIQMIELALENRNKIAAKKFITRVDTIIQHNENLRESKLRYDLLLLAAKYKHICGEFEPIAKKKYDYIVETLNLANTVVNAKNASQSSQVQGRHLIFKTISCLINIIKADPNFLNFLNGGDFMSTFFEASERKDPLETLHNFRSTTLKESCKMGSISEKANSYAKFGKFCYSMLQDSFHRSPEIILEFISSILNGMHLGSLECAHYFPYLLKQDFYRDHSDAVELFITKCKNIPTWLFLSWQAQIISFLGKPFAKLLFPIVERLIVQYPNGILYNFRQTYEAAPQLRIIEEVRRMYELLFSDSKMEIFFEAFNRLCQPEHYLRDNLVQLLNSAENFSSSLNSLLNKIFNCPQKDQLQGPVYVVLDKYKADLEKLNGIDFETVKNYISKILLELNEAVEKRLDNAKRRALQLKDYCPYLSHFSKKNLEIEVPGQYSGDKKPMPRYHTKISRFDHFVTIMESKRKPMKIGIIGNDAKKYNFLVKFGEDLRQDQRLQQIFAITNKTLNSDSTCKQRYLSINTYQVVPFSTSLGLIQWVEDTKSFKDFIEFSLDNKRTIEIAASKYNDWIQKAVKRSEKGVKINCYKEALVKYGPEDVISKMNELTNYIKWDYLRKTFVMLSPSVEGFITLRHNFIKSYATMCIVHWITGVGDRHLENTLIEVKTGKCCGIDFGLAFGIGIDQSVPELVPFRLTSQILGLFQPFDEKDLLGFTMTHVLNALRKQSEPMLACLDVFIHEPVEWNKYLNKRLPDDERMDQDVKWLPKRKIDIVKKKLSGMKPSTIMLEELSIYHADIDESNEGYFSKYEHIINGTDGCQISVRSRINGVSLTPEEQVQCLLDQATDLNILGRMYVGWLPFL